MSTIFNYKRYGSCLSNCIESRGNTSSFYYAGNGNNSLLDARDSAPVQETGLETVRAVIEHLSSVIPGPVGQFEFVVGLAVYTSAGAYHFYIPPTVKAALKHSVFSGMFNDTAVTVSFLQSQFCLPPYFHLPYKFQIGVNHLQTPRRGLRVTDYIAPCNPSIITVDKYATYKLELYLDLIQVSEETQEFIDIGFFLGS